MRVTTIEPQIRERTGQLAPKEGLRLVECPYQVLSLGQVHSCLAPDAAVHLRQERRWEVDEGDPAEQRRGDKSGQIPDHASTQSD